MSRVNQGLAQDMKLALRVAQEATDLATDFLRKKFGRFRSLSEKPEAGLVTEADRGAERLVVRHIRKFFPHHSILGEEGGATSSGHSLRWVIDPLDGTTNFVHGFPVFCTSIGLEHEGTPLLGVICNPISGDRYWGMKGHGAYKDKIRLKVSRTTNLGEAMLATGFSYRRDELLEKELRSFHHVIRKSRAIRRLGSAALDLCYVASGQFDGFFENNLAPWDVTAGLLLLTEAGGAYSDYRGKPYALGGPTLLATNGKIHRSLIKTLA